MGLAGERLERYMGSQHSAVGFLLATFGLIAVGMGLFALSAPDEIPMLISVPMVAWALVALPLGVSMRRKRPGRAMWVLAIVLLGFLLLTFVGIAFLGRIGNG